MLKNVNPEMDYAKWFVDGAPRYHCELTEKWVAGTEAGAVAMKSLRNYIRDDGRETIAKHRDNVIDWLYSRLCLSHPGDYGRGYVERLLYTLLGEAEKAAQ